MSDLTLVIGNKNYSSWSLRPWIWLKQAGVAFAERRVPLFTETMEADLAPYFSGNKVPVLIDGDAVIWDSLAILEYLAERFPHAPGWPEDRMARAMARSVSAEMHSGFFELRDALPMNCRKRFPEYPIRPAVQADIDRIAAIWERARAGYGASGPWLFGGFSIADAMYAPVVFRLWGYDVKLRGVVRDYVEHFLAQPAMQAWKAAGEAETEILAVDEVQA